MSAFTLEIVRRGETPTVADVVTLPNGRVIWRQVEALALLIESAEDTFIQVKNEQGETVIRAGVKTALASIRQCSCMSCPLKRALAKRSVAEAGLVSDKLAFYPCERGVGSRDLEAFSP